VFTPQFIFELFPIFLAKEISRLPLQLSHQVGDGKLGWKRKQQMDMIIFSVKFMQNTTHLITGFCKKVFQPGKHVFGKNITPIFCHKDKMQIDIINTASACSPFIFFIHILDPFVKIWYRTIQDKFQGKI
jgi:hypothetical protein